ncbi:MAG: hypothetical protein HYR85_27985 [Planctomycetes bacterium]|nr:hypothetical protein [Planctomycetota bacterium]MBI3846119.1 hypothetical protein [Planctomycetota bacterium]
MSDAPGRKLLLLSVRFIVFFALFAGLWVWGGRWYGRAIAIGLDAVTPIAERDHRLTIDWRELTQLPQSVVEAYEAQDRVAGPGDLVFIFGKKHGDFLPLHADVHFNVVLLLSLLCATLVNVPLPRRMIWIVAALAFLYAYTVVQVEMYAQLAYASGRAGEALALLFTDGQRSFLDQASNLAKFGERGFPVLLWLAIFLATRTAPPEPSKSSPPTPPTAPQVSPVSS